MDVDNDSENESDWLDAEKLHEMFRNYDHVIFPSRHNMIPKDGKKARPKNHILFRTKKYTDSSAYNAAKVQIQEKYSFFDSNALSAARFFFGCDVSPEYVIWNETGRTIDEDFSGASEDGKTNQASASVIQQGTRNSTMSRFAGCVLIRYGNSEKALQVFREEAAKCDPPLDDDELSKIWQSAVRFAGKVSKSDGYVPPEKYNNDFGSGKSLRPADFSDIGQAKIIAREYGSELRYTEGTDYIRYNGIYWEESRQAAVGAAEEFLDLQLQDATDQMEAALHALVETGANEELLKKGGKTAEKALDENNQEQLKLFKKYMSAVAYYAFVMKRRDMKYVTSALQALKPMVCMKVTDLDQNEFLLNTPSYTYDLRKGMAGRRQHDPSDLITKCTLVDPDDIGMDIWEKAVGEFFCGDQELIDYAQMISGLMAIGKVFVEALIIAYGDGRNGKSTYWNSQARVLGNYSGGISADALTIGCKRNVKPEMAELRGKRMVIAAELEGGMRLSNSVIKQLCSTDEVGGEKKYKDPFKFVPTHQLILYTNHLPKVGSSDEGIWRRLIVIPFNAQFEGKSDIKNYTDYLVANAGPAILKWIIEGAKKVIAKDYKPVEPKCVRDAKKEYREQNN